MISTLFAQFRHQYADGSLTTEFINTYAEQHLVKATVSVGGQVIATALAADPNLATADDQAKVRVLAMLGFDSAAAAPKPVAAQTIKKSTVKPVDKSQKPMPPADTASSVETSAIDQTIHGSETIEDDDMGRPLESFAPEEAPAPSDVPASSLAAVALENFDDTNPVDLSDIIAQTDVEMTRLGWSSIQGRQYLEKTFNKRSRQQLTDEELLTFLLYLESQATPSMG